MKTKSIFLSHPINLKTPLYGGSNEIKITKNSSIKNGDTANSLRISLPNHAGTHIDVPYHFFNDGKKITDYNPSYWVFNNPKCIDFPSEDGYLIKYEDIKNKINHNDDLLLIRTGYEKNRSEKKYWQKNPGLSSCIARNIRKKHPQIRAVGVDVISITSFSHRSEGRIAHKEFLGNHSKISDPILLIEDMSLKNYNDQFKKVTIMPLLIEDGDGAPCTVIAQ